MGPGPKWALGQVRCPKHGTLIQYRTDPKLVQNWSKTGPEVVHKVSGAIWIHLDRFPAQTEPWRPKTTQISFLGNQIWVYAGHILPNLLETVVLWVQMVKLKRCAPKNDAENRWNFVKWTNGDPKSTRKLGWIWVDFGWF